MARRKTASGGEAAIIVVVLLFFVIILAAPIFMLTGYFRNKFLAVKEKSKIRHKTEDYWLSQEEMSLFKALHSEIFIVEGRLESERKRGIDAGVSVNKDGSFSARSNLGKELQKNISDLSEKIHAYRNRYKYLQMKPRLNWSRDHDRYQSFSDKAAGYKWGLSGWVAAAFFYKYYDPSMNFEKIVLSYWTMATFLLDSVPGRVEFSAGNIVALSVVTGASLVIFFIRKKFTFWTYQKCPRPEVVSITNVDGC